MGHRRLWAQVSEDTPPRGAGTVSSTGKGLGCRRSTLGSCHRMRGVCVVALVLELQRKRKPGAGASASPFPLAGDVHRACGTCTTTVGERKALISRCAADQSIGALENSTGPQPRGRGQSRHSQGSRACRQTEQGRGPEVLLLGPKERFQRQECGLAWSWVRGRAHLPGSTSPVPQFPLHAGC